MDKKVFERAAGDWAHNTTGRAAFTELARGCDEGAARRDRLLAVRRQYEPGQTTASVSLAVCRIVDALIGPEAPAVNPPAPKMVEYQAATEAFVTYKPEHAKTYTAMGLAGEVGEVVELLKRPLRGEGEVDTAKLSKELGDVLFYLARVAAEHGLNLGDVAVENLAKLADRKARGVLHGTGSDR